MTYKDPVGLERTLTSLGHIRAELGDQVEVLVIDGGADVRVESLDESIEPPNILISERDAGIYDGMNKGLRRSTGRFVWFLNGGDENLFKSADEVRGLLEDQASGLIAAGYELRVGVTSVRRRSRPPRYLWHGLPTSHQAIFYAGDLARLHSYDLSYRVAADYAFTARLSRAGAGWLVSDAQVAAFHHGGHSTSHSAALRRDAWRVQHEILGLPLHVRLASRARHRVSSAMRQVLSTAATRPQ